METQEFKNSNVNLYMLAIINANHEEFLNILEFEEVTGKAYTLSTANIVFESMLNTEDLLNIFKTYDMTRGTNFVLLDITPICYTTSFGMNLNTKTNPKIQEMMQFFLAFFDPEELKESIHEKSLANAENIDKILEKINTKGIKSLNRREKRMLEEYSTESK